MTRCSPNDVARGTRAQTLGEYVLLIGIIATALIGMQTYLKRGVQAGIKVAADQMVTFQRDTNGDGVPEAVVDGALAQIQGARQESGDRTNSVVGGVGQLLVQASAQRMSAARRIHKTRQPDAAGGGSGVAIEQDDTGTTGAVDSAGTSSQTEVVSAVVRSE